MNNKKLIKEYFETLDDNEIVTASVLYKEKFLNVMTEQNYYKILERLTKEETISKVSKGLYKKANKNKYGIIDISEKELIKQFVQNEAGMEIGMKLFVDLNLSTQISKKRKLLSSNINSQTKIINNISVKKVNLRFDSNHKKIITCLEILQNYNNVEDFNWIVFVNKLEDFIIGYNDEVFTEVVSNIKYKKKTISFYKMILDHYHILNSLNQYLSSLSFYNHPTMEDLFDFTSRQKTISRINNTNS
jgi:hypothetical protein